MSCGVSEHIFAYSSHYGLFSLMAATNSKYLSKNVGIEEFLHWKASLIWQKITLEHSDALSNLWGLVLLLFSEAVYACVGYFTCSLCLAFSNLKWTSSTDQNSTHP